MTLLKRSWQSNAALKVGQMNLSGREMKEACFLYTFTVLRQEALGGCSVSLIYFRELAHICENILTGAYSKQGTHVTPITMNSDHIRSVVTIPQKIELFSVW